MKSQTRRIEEAKVQVGKLIDEYGAADLLGFIMERLVEGKVTRQAEIISEAIDKLLWKETKQ